MNNCELRQLFIERAILSEKSVDRGQDHSMVIQDLPIPSRENIAKFQSAMSKQMA